MIKKLLGSMALVSSLLITGCASVPMASKEADSAAKSFAANGDKANIYVYRNETFGAAVKLPVLIDGSSVGDTVAKSYILKSVQPGKHTVLSKSESDSSVVVDAQAGKNYFVWQEVKMGMMSAGSQVHLVDEAKGKAGVNECKLIQ